MAFVVASSASPAWGASEEWVQEDAYLDIGAVESDQLRVVVSHSSVQLLEGGRVLELPIPVDPVAHVTRVDTNGARIIVSRVVDDFTTSQVVVTDMQGNLIAERSWHRLNPGALDVAIWRSYAIVGHSNAVAVYDLETLEFVARLLEGPFADGYIPLVRLGSGNDRLLIGVVESAADSDDQNKYLTVHEIDPSLAISNTIGPLAWHGLVPQLAPAPEGGLYLAHEPYIDPKGLLRIFQFDSGGNMVDSMAGLSTYLWGGIDVDGCFNIIGVTAGALSYAPDIHKGIKWVPDSRNAGCFVDVLGHVFEPDIAWLGRGDITRGCNPPLKERFCPEELVTRSQLAAFLVRALEYTDGEGTDLFVDDDSSIFETDIDRLATAGVTRGCNPPTNDRFCPDDFVTRGQMAAFLVRALEYTDGDGTDLFVDDDSSIFETDIDRLATAGVTRGCNPPTNDRFCPDDFVTRGQMAAFLHRALRGP